MQSHPSESDMRDPVPSRPVARPVAVLRSLPAVLALGVGLTLVLAAALGQLPGMGAGPGALSRAWSDAGVGEPAHLSLLVMPESMPFDGTSAAQVLAIVTDSAGDPVSGLPVRLEVTGAEVSRVTDLGDGSYGASVTPAARAADPGRPLAIRGWVQDSSVRGEAALAALAPLRLQVTPDRLERRAGAYAEITVTGEMGVGLAVEPGAVQVHAQPGRVEPAGGERGKVVARYLPPTEGSARSAMVWVTHSARPGLVLGKAVVSLSAPGAAEALAVESPAGRPSLELSAQPAKLIADGRSLTVVTATVLDELGRPQSGGQSGGDAPQFYSNHGEVLGVASTGAGTWQAFVRAPSVRGSGGMWVTARSAAGAPARVEVGLVSGPPARIQIEPSSSYLAADGRSKANLVIRLTDAAGNPVDGREIRLWADVGRVSNVVFVGGGEYRATYLAPADPLGGKVNLSAELGLTAGQGLEGGAGAPAGMVAFATPGERPNETVLGILVLDDRGRGVPGEVVQLSGREGVPSRLTTDRSGLARTVLRGGDAPKVWQAQAGLVRAAGLTASTPVFEGIKSERLSHPLVKLAEGLARQAQVRTMDATGTLHASLSLELVGSGDLPPELSLSGSAEPKTLHVAANPAVLLAGQGEVSIVVSVSDADGRGMPGRDLRLEADAGTLTTPMDNGDGTYSAAFFFGGGFAPTGAVRVWAVDGASGLRSTPAEIKVLPLDPEEDATQVVLSVDRNTLPADPGETFLAQAEVRNLNGRPVPDGTPVTFRTAGQEVEARTVGGVATARLAASDAAGPAPVTAEAGLAKARSAVEFQAGAPASVVVTLTPDRLAASPDARFLAVARVLDANGNPVADGTPVSLTWMGRALASVTLDGEARAMLPARPTVGEDRLVATSGTGRGEAVLRVTPGQPSRAELAVLGLDANRVVASGQETFRAQVRVFDKLGNAVEDGTPVSLRLDDQARAGRTKDGMVTAEFRALSRLGTALLEVQSQDVRAQLPLAFVAGPPATLRLVGERPQVAAGQRARLRVRVEDAWRHPVADGTEVEFVASAGEIAAMRRTSNGEVEAEYWAEAAAGPVLVSARAGDARLDTEVQVTAGTALTLRFIKPLGERLTLLADGTAILRVEVELRDAGNNPVPNRRVDFTAEFLHDDKGVAGNGRAGTLEPAYIVTDTRGMARVTYIPSHDPGLVALKAFAREDTSVAVSTFLEQLGGKHSLELAEFTIIEPQGAVDATVTRGQVFKLRARVDDKLSGDVTGGGTLLLDLGNTGADLENGDSLSKSFLLGQDVVWTLRAGDLTGKAELGLSIQTAPKDRVTGRSADVNESKRTASMDLTTEHPPSLTLADALNLAQVSKGQAGIRYEVTLTNEGDAGIAGTGQVELDLSGAGGLELAAGQGAAVDFTADDLGKTFGWDLAWPANPTALPSGVFSLKARISQAPLDANTREDGSSDDEYNKAAALTSAGQDGVAQAITIQSPAQLAVQSMDLASGFGGLLKQGQAGGYVVTVVNNGEARAVVSGGSAAFYKGSLGSARDEDLTTEYSTSVSGLPVTVEGNGGTAQVTFSFTASDGATLNNVVFVPTLSGSDENAGDALEDTPAVGGEVGFFVTPNVAGVRWADATGTALSADTTLFLAGETKLYVQLLKEGGAPKSAVSDDEVSVVTVSVVGASPVVQTLAKTGVVAGGLIEVKLTASAVTEGTAQIQADYQFSLDVFSATHNVIVSAVDVASMTLALDKSGQTNPSSMTADETVTAVVELFDGQGAHVDPAGAGLVSLAATLGGNDVSGGFAAAQVVGSAGSQTIQAVWTPPFGLLPNGAQTLTITASWLAGGATPPANQTALISVAPGALSLADSDIALSASTGFVGTTSITATITAQDAHGNPLSGQAATLVEKDGKAGLGISPSTLAATDANGETTATLTATAADTYTLVATVGGVTLTDQPTVTYSAAPTASFALVVKSGANTVSTAAAGTSLTLEVTALSGGVADTSYTGSHTLGYTFNGGSLSAAPDGTAATQPTASVTFNNGVGTATFTPVKAEGPISISVSEPSDSARSAGTAALTVTAEDLVDAADSTVAASPSSGVPADGSTAYTATITLKDRFGNPLSGKTATLSAGSASAQVNGSAALGDVSIGSSGSDGVVKSAGVLPVVTATSADTYTLVATSGGVTVTQQPSVIFDAPPAETPDSFQVELVSGLTSLTAGTAFEVKLTALKGGLAMNGSAASSFDSALAVDLSHTGTSHAQDAGLPFSQSLTFTAGVAQTTGQNFKLHSAAGSHGIAASASSGTITGALSGLTITPDAVLASASAVSIDSGSKLANGSQSFTVTVTLQDPFGNVVSGEPGSNVTLNAADAGVGLAGVAGNGNTNVALSGTTNASGQVTATVTSVTAGTKTVTAKHSGATIGTTGTVQAAFIPTAVEVTVQQTGSDVTTLTAGTTYQLKIQAKEGAGGTSNSATYTGGSYALSFSGTGITALSSLNAPNASQSASASQSSGIALTNGTASVDLVVYKSGATDFKVTATDSTFNLTDATPNLTINTAAVSAPAGSVSANPTSGVLSDGTTTSTVTVTLKDSFGNLKVGEAGSNVTLTAGDATVGIGGSSGAADVPLSGTTNASGQVTGSVTSTSAGTKTITAKHSGATIGSAQIVFTGSTFQVVVNSGSAATAGSAVSVQLTALNASGGTDTSYTGSKTIDLSSTATNSPNSTAPTIPTSQSVSFSLGVGTATGFTFTNATETPTVTATDNTASPAIAGTSDPVTVNAGAVSASVSTISHTPSSGVQGNDSSSYTVTVTAKDALGNPVAGKAVTLQATAATGPIGDEATSDTSIKPFASGSYQAGNTARSIGTTDSSGQAQGSVKTNDEEGATYTMQAVADSVTLTTTDSLVFSAVTAATKIAWVSGKAPPSTSPIDTSLGTIQVQLLDGAGSPVLENGRSVSLQVKPGTGTSSLAGTTAVTTDASGIATWTGITYPVAESGVTIEAVSTGLTNAGAQKTGVSFTAATGSMDIELVSADNMNVTQGDSGKFVRVTVRNTGDTTISLNSGSVGTGSQDLVLQFANGGDDSSNYTVGFASFSPSGATISPGATKQISFTVAVGGSAATGTTTITASVKGTDPAVVTATGTSQSDTWSVASASGGAAPEVQSVTVTPTAPMQTQTMTLSFTVFNAGSNAASVTLAPTIKQGATDLIAAGQYTRTTPDSQLTTTVLASDTSQVTVNYLVSGSAATGVTITGNATLTGTDSVTGGGVSDLDGATTPATWTVSAARGALSLGNLSVSPTAVDPGTPVTVSIPVTNTGLKTVTISSGTVNPQFAYTKNTGGASANAGLYSLGSVSFEENSAPVDPLLLSPGEQGVIKQVVNVPGGATPEISVANVTQVSGTDTAGTVTSGAASGTASFTVNGAILGVTLTNPFSTVVAPGASFVLWIKVKNTGTSAGTGTLGVNFYGGSGLDQPRTWAANPTTQSTGSLGAGETTSGSGLRFDPVVAGGNPDEDVKIVPTINGVEQTAQGQTAIVTVQSGGGAGLTGDSVSSFDTNVSPGGGPYSVSVTVRNSGSTTIKITSVSGGYSDTVNRFVTLHFTSAGGSRGDLDDQFDITSYSYSGTTVFPQGNKTVTFGVSPKSTAPPGVVTIDADAHGQDGGTYTPPGVPPVDVTGAVQTQTWTVDPAPAAVVTELSKDAPTSVYKGSTGRQFSVTVINTGTLTLENATAVFSVPSDNANFPASSGSNKTQTGLNFFGNGNQGIVSFNVDVDANAAAGTGVAWQVQIDGTEQNTGTPRSLTISGIMDVLAATDAVLSAGPLTVSQSTAYQGSFFSVSVQVTNTGGSAAVIQADTDLVLAVQRVSDNADKSAEVQPTVSFPGLGSPADPGPPAIPAVPSDYPYSLPVGQSVQVSWFVDVDAAAELTDVKFTVSSFNWTDSFDSSTESLSVPGTPVVTIADPVPQIVIDQVTVQNPAVQGEAEVPIVVLYKNTGNFSAEIATANDIVVTFNPPNAGFTNLTLSGNQIFPLNVTGGGQVQSFNFTVDVGGSVTAQSYTVDATIAALYDADAFGPSGPDGVAETPCGDSDGATSKGTLVVNAPGPAPTTARITAQSPTVLYQGRAADLSGADSTAFAGVVTAWEWDFDGDGTVDSVLEDPAPWTYLLPGTWTAWLTVRDAFGGYDTASLDVLVVADTVPPSASYLGASPDPFAPGGTGTAGQNATLDVDLADFESGMAGWELRVYNGTALIRTLTGTATSNGVQSTVWDGRSGAGEVQDSGVYDLEVEAIDLAGNRSPAATGSIQIDNSLQFGDYGP